MPGEPTLVFVLQTLKEEWREYKDLKDGERREFEQLEDDLRLLQSFLTDSANKSGKKDLFKEMERQIRELVYDVEDTIEICLTKKAAAKAKISSRILKMFRTGLAKRVRTLREEKVKPILGLIERDFGKIDSSTPSLEKPYTEVKLDRSTRQPAVTFIHDQSTGQQSVTTTPEHSSAQDQSNNLDRDQPPETHTHDQSTGQQSVATTQENSSAQDQSNNLDKVVDFEDEATIIGYLMEPKDRLDVISITGMAGLGKTTFARKISHEEEICRKFPLRIWIRVSQKFNSRDAFLSILERLAPQGTSSPSDEELITALRRCLANKEFLLVIDDLWTVNDWEVIRKILPEENGKGKVVVTSRQKDVAVQVNISRKPHELSLLNEQKSLELLKLKVFGNLESCPPELEDLGQDIANKCGGLPLAIVVIGGFLKSQFTKTRALVGLQEKWSNVFEKVNHILQEDKDKSISNVLDLSYSNLPDDSRVCFLYTGLFPENHEIPASTLTQLWIAEGFIRPKGKSFEENAEEILDDLINMNLLMVTKKNLDQVKTCRVHHMIREFCKTKATEENLFRVVKEANGVIEPPVSEVQRFRRLCLHSDLSNFLSKKPNGPRVRSFLCFFEEPLDLNPMHISTIPKAFNLLRVLSCNSIKFGQFPKVAGLILLKHITLSIDNLDVLPEQIFQLLNLRTLIVETNSRSITVKANIWKMSQLRRLKTKAAIFLEDKNWTGKASENLQTITRLSPESCKETLSERAPNLKRFGIRGKVADLFNTFSLNKFLLLKKLKIVNELLLHESAYTPVHARLDCFPPNLTSLTLSNTYLKWDDHMPILAGIKALKALKLKDNAFVGISWNSVGDGFGKLQFLLIENTKLVIWKASTTDFLSLRWLVLKRCQDLQEIPKDIEKNLEKLEIEHVNKSAADSARTIESIKKKAKQEQNQISACGVPFKLTIGEGCS